MVDIGGPDYEINKAEIEFEIQQHRLNVRAGDLRKLKLQKESDQIDHNNAATVKVIAELEGKLENLNKPQEGDEV